MNGCLLVQDGVSRQGELLENGSEEVGLLVVLLRLLRGLFRLVQSVSCLLVNRLLKDLAEESIRIWLSSQLQDLSLVGPHGLPVVVGSVLVRLDLGLTVLLHLVNELVELLCPASTLVLFALAVVHVVGGHKFQTRNLLRWSEDLTLLVVVVDVDHFLIQVEDALPNLLIGCLVCI